jgi:rhodanese-related sulfurtransferase
VSAELEIPPQRARELLASGAAQAVDVREPYEWEAGHLDGARHIELRNVPAEAGAVEGPVVFYCRSGERSAMAAEAFAAAGREAYTLAGGLLAWADAGLPLAGTVADRSPLP